MPSQAQDANGARTKCTEFGFKENTKSHEECVKQFLNSMGSAKTTPVKKPISTPPESTSTDDQKEDDYWKEAKSVGNKEAFEAYLKFYPRGRYVGLANARITQLNKLESEKVENNRLNEEKQKYLPCATTLTFGDWTNCVGTYNFLAENQWKGDKYVGGFKDGKFSGQGVYTNSNGNKYVGEFKDNQPNGQGTYFNLADNQWKGDKYVGEFRDGKRTQGTYYYLAENQWKGDRYIGEFRDGKPNGQGAFLYLGDNPWKGDKYVGAFKDGNYNGQGTYYYQAENQWKGDIHVGEYRDGKRNGQGTYYYLAENQWKGYKYVGEYRDGKRNGRGVFFGPSGNVIYSGNFLNDKETP